MPSFFEMTIFWVSLKATYYWLMYVLWFIAWNYIIYKRNIIPKNLIDDLFFYIFLGLLLWWRLWYVIFYNLSYYLSNPIDILKLWEWWMSFHWWAIWVIIAMIVFAKQFKFDFYKLADQVTLVVPIWLWLWRIWNYINKELLWFSWYNWPFAVIKNWESYFPSPLLESLLEGVVLFLLLNFIYTKNKSLKSGQIACLFLIFYAVFRLIIEIFFRQPDSNIWYILWYFTMWEFLSIPMIIIWFFYFFKLKKNV